MALGLLAILLLWLLPALVSNDQEEQGTREAETGEPVRAR